MTRINGAGRHRVERRCTVTVKIRYRDANELSPGLRAAAERHGRTVTVYLLPGLTAAERDAAVRRLRLSGRMGYGPRLPVAQLAFALFANRIRATIAQAGSVFRAHPAGASGPVMLISAGAIAFLMLSAVSIRILREPSGPHGPSASGPAPAASAVAVRMPGSAQHQAADPAGSQGWVLTAAQSGSDPLPVPTSPDLPGNGSSADPGTGTGSTGTGTGGGTTAGGGAGSAPDPTDSATTPGSPPVTVSVSPSNPAPSTSDSGSAPTSAPDPVSASVAPSVSVSGSGLPSVSASVPASAYTSDPVSVSASVAVSASASLPTSGSGSSAPAPSPAVTASVTGAACLDVGPLGVCLDA